MNNFRLLVLSERSKVVQALLKMIIEVADNITYLDNSDKIEALNLLNSLVMDINKLYDKVEEKGKT